MPCRRNFQSPGCVNPKVDMRNFSLSNLQEMEKSTTLPISENLRIEEIRIGSAIAVSKAYMKWV